VDINSRMKNFVDKSLDTTNDLKKTLIPEKVCTESISKKLDYKIKQNTDQIPKVSSYGEIVPGKYELNCDAPLVPYQYQKFFNINKISNQEVIGNVDNFIFSFSTMGMEENSSYMRIFPPPHILL
jgi:hypothetical protein